MEPDRLALALHRWGGGLGAPPGRRGGGWADDRSLFADGLRAKLGAGVGDRWLRGWRRSCRTALRQDLRNPTAITAKIPAITFVGVVDVITPVAAGWRFGLWGGKAVFDICRFTARHGRKRNACQGSAKNGRE